MIHIYKDGGIRKTAEGIEYTIKAINSDDLTSYLRDGWLKSKEELKPKPKPVKKKKAKGD